MKYKIIIIPAIFLSLITGKAHSQLEELLALGGMTQGLQSQGMIQENLGRNEKSTNEASKEEEKPIDPDAFLDDEFGFKGRENFDGLQESKKFEKPLEYYGYSFFIDAPSTFALKDEMSVSEDYIIGPGDNFQAVLFGTKNQKFQMEVTREGAIFFPEIGPISVAGLTFGEAKRLINQLVSKDILGTSVEISLDDIRTISVFVLGEVLKPGLYTVSSLATLTNAIISSGGIKKTGSLRNIQLKRNGKIIRTLDMYNLMLNGDTSNDSKLLPGDVIFIPPVETRVAVYGEVNRPAIYEILDSEKLSDLIKYSGNLKPKANKSQVEIIRVNQMDNGFKMESLDLKKVDSSNYSLSNGDVLRIYPINNDMQNAILITGHAKNEGFFPLSGGNNKITDIIKNRDDLLSMTQHEYILIKRINSDGTGYDFFQTDLSTIFTDPNSSKNISLKEKDELIFLPRLLLPDLIKTRLIQDEFKLDLDTGMPIPKEIEWQSPTFLRKSLLEQEIELEEKNKMNIAAGLPAVDKITSPQMGRYYEYSVHNYCSIPQDLVINIIQKSDYDQSESNSIPLEQLEAINDPNQLQKLIDRMQSGDIDTDSNDGYTRDSDLSNELTLYCRNQIMSPILDLIDQQKTNSNSKRTVFIFGNVHFPGEYPLTSKMNLSDIIKASGGLKEATYNSEIEITRRDVSGKKASFSNKLASSVSESDLEIELRPGDTVTVKQIKKEIITVEVTGEVHFNGTYPITEYQTLRELIERSGGLTQFASPKGAVFQRQSLKNSEIKRFSEAQDELRRKILLSSNAGGLGEKSLDSNAIQMLTSLVGMDNGGGEALGRLVIDLEGILNGTVPDIILEDGDMIHVPRLQQTVTVIGEVFAPNTHLFSESLTLNDYINQSGGSNVYADEESIYLIKSDGSIIPSTKFSGGSFFRSRDNFIQPGDTIVVPLLVTPFSGIKATTEITQIIYQMALAAAAVNSFTN